MLTSSFFGRICTFITCLALLAAVSCKTTSKKVSEERMVSLFDGSTLAGWDGDPTYWRVENGCIVGEVTPATLLKRNSFLIWRGGLVADFELSVEYRVSANGNSGINYRSEEIEGVKYALRGYQADLDGAMLYTGSNYEEGRRTTLAARGSKVLLPPAVETPGANLSVFITNNVWTKSQTLEKLGHPDSLARYIRREDWNQYRLLVRGNRLQHYINGLLMSDVTDNDKVNRRLQGLLGVQVHIGPPMKIEYRNFLLKRL